MLRRMHRAVSYVLSSSISLGRWPSTPSASSRVAGVPSVNGKLFCASCITAEKLVAPRYPMFHSDCGVNVSGEAVPGEWCGSTSPDDGVDGDWAATARPWIRYTQLLEVPPRLHLEQTGIRWSQATLRLRHGSHACCRPLRRRGAPGGTGEPECEGMSAQTAAASYPGITVRRPNYV